MADEIFKRDPNHVHVAGALQDGSEDVAMLRVDPSTKYLLVEIAASGASSANASQIASRDPNHVPVFLAWDEQNQVLQEVLTDADGNLLVDLEIL